MTLYSPYRRAARAAVRIAFRRLMRKGFTGEAQRMRLIDATEASAVDLLERLAAKRDLSAIPVRQVLDELAHVLVKQHLQAELNYRMTRS